MSWQQSDRHIRPRFLPDRLVAFSSRGVGDHDVDALRQTLRSAVCINLNVLRQDWIILLAFHLSAVMVAQEWLGSLWHEHWWV